MSRSIEIGEKRRMNRRDTAEIEETGLGFQIRPKRACQNFYILKTLAESESQHHRKQWGVKLEHLGGRDQIRKSLEQKAKNFEISSEENGGAIKVLKYMNYKTSLVLDN